MYEHNVINEQRDAQLINRWRTLLEAKDTGLGAIDTKHKAVTTAALLENQYNYMKNNPQIYGRVPELVEENGLTNQSGVMVGAGADYDTGEFGNAIPTNKDFYAPNDARLPNVIMPMIRRTYPELLAHEICGVQAMNAPVGMAFALRFKYEGESLAHFSPDGGNGVTAAGDTNEVPNTGFPKRAAGQEAGYNYIDTSHTGVTSDKLVGNADFDFIPEDQGVAALLSQTEFSSHLPQMSLAIEKTAVEAGTRKLALKYSLELEQDLKNMHNLSVDDEMTGMMSYELQAEIDRELLLRMLNIALTAGAGAGYTTWNPANADGRWSAERAVNLWQHIRVQARLIQLRNRRGSANFAVVTPFVVSILETLPQFKAFTIDSNVQQIDGNSRAGSLGSLKVFVDTRTEAQYQAGTRGARVDYILLGYKGQSAWDTGLVYLPYIPVMVQRTMGPNDFSPRIGLSTRYGVVSNLFGSENYYHVIVLKGLTGAIDQTADKQFMWPASGYQKPQQPSVG